MYESFRFKDYPDTSTPIISENLNKIDAGIIEVEKDVLNTALFLPLNQSERDYDKIYVGSNRGEYGLIYNNYDFVPFNNDDIVIDKNDLDYPHSVKTSGNYTYSKWAMDAYPKMSEVDSSLAYIDLKCVDITFTASKSTVITNITNTNFESDIAILTEITSDGFEPSDPNVISVKTKEVVPGTTKITYTCKYEKDDTTPELGFIVNQL